MVFFQDEVRWDKKSCHPDSIQAIATVLSATIITTRLFQRSTSAPATGSNKICGSKATRVTVPGWLPTLS